MLATWKVITKKDLRKLIKRKRERLRDAHIKVKSMQMSSLEGT